MLESWAALGDKLVFDSAIIERASEATMPADLAPLLQICDKISIMILERDIATNRAPRSALAHKRSCVRGFAPLSLLAPAEFN